MCVVAERKKGFQPAKWVKKWLGGKCWIVSGWKEKNERDMKDPFPSFVLAAHLRISCLARKNPLPLSLVSICHVGKFIRAKETFYTRKRFKSHQIGWGSSNMTPLHIFLGHQYGGRDVMWQYFMYANVSYNVRQVIHLSQGILIS